MRTSKIASMYNIDQDELEGYVKRAKLDYTTGITGMNVSDEYDLDDLVEKAKASIAKRRDKEQEEKRAQEQFEQEKQEAISQMLITSGFNFDGYTITKYSGYISGDDVVEISRGTGGIFVSATNVGSALSSALVTIRRNALAELKEAAYALGCNAVIGVDFDYITLDPETANGNGGTLYLPYVFCVTANGNAVIIEKDE